MEDWQPAEGKPGTEEDILQKGSLHVAAGYIIYGSSTMLVFTTGEGFHGFTLDPSFGEFYLSHPEISDEAPKFIRMRVMSYKRSELKRFKELIHVIY